VTQSGLHGLSPGTKPNWSATEGLAEGTSASPVRAFWSGLSQPNTITCFEGAVPKEWIVTG
jgi:hypothetical protein